MAITDKNTVLVLGAGVSAPFGLPLGGDLMDGIARRLGEELDEIMTVAGTARKIDTYIHLPIRNPIYDNEMRATKKQREWVLQHRILSALAAYCKNQSEVNPESDCEGLFHIYCKDLLELRELLLNQTSETIDDFIAQNPKYAELTKLCIAVELAMACYNPNAENVSGDVKFILKPFLTRAYNVNKNRSKLELKIRSTKIREQENKNERNWIHLLINVIREGKVRSENKVKIITFNYDQILEHVLEKQFSNTELLQGKTYKDYIEVIHFHGKCGPLQALDDISDERGSSHQAKMAYMCADWARGIHVVNEEEGSPKLLSGRNRAKYIIQSATELYFCGFAFSGPNCEQLGLTRSYANVRDRQIIYCNYDGNIGLQKLVERKLYTEVPSAKPDGWVPKTTISPAEGTLEKPLGVSNWIRAGYIGDMPG